MVNTVGHALALYESAAEQSVEHITADVAVNIVTGAAQSIGSSAGMACGAIAMAGMAYKAVRNQSELTRDRAEAHRAREKARACQELLELTEEELAGLYVSYRGQRRALIGLRELLKAKENELRAAYSEALVSNLPGGETQVASLNAELTQRTERVRELSRSLVIKQSMADHLTGELAKRYAEVERLLVDLAGQDREVGRLTQESEEKVAEIDRLTIKSVEDSGTLQKSEMRVRALTAELTDTDFMQPNEVAGTDGRSHGMQDITRTEDKERDRVHILAGDMAIDRPGARQDQAREDSLADEWEVLRRELAHCREFGTAQLAEKDKEMTIVRQQASAKESGMHLEITELKDRCSALLNPNIQSSDIAQENWDLRESEQTREQEYFRERAVRLSGDVIELKGILNEERVKSEALAKEVCASIKTENEATAREDTLKMDLADELKRCAAIERKRDQSSEIFQEQLNVREVNMKKERERHLVELNDRLNEERAKLERLVQEACASMKTENAKLTDSLVQAADETAAAESRAAQELSGLKEEATAREAALKVKLEDALNRCTVVERERDQCSAVFWGQWEAREASLKGERERLQERTEQLSGYLRELTECLQTERAQSEALAEEACASMKAENAKLVSSLAQETRKAVAAESRAVRSEQSLEVVEARLAGMEARFSELTAGASKAIKSLDRKTAEVESFTEDFTQARRAAAAAGSRVSAPEVQMDDTCRNVSASKRKMARLGEELDKGQTDNERSRLSNWGRHQSSAELMLETPFEDLVQRKADIVQEVVPYIAHDRAESRDSKGAYTTVMLVGEEDEAMLLPKGTRQGVLMVLQGDFGVTMGYNRPSHTVSIKGATVEVHRAVVPRLRSALAHCSPVYDQDPRYSFLVTNMAPPRSTDPNDSTSSWWQSKVYTHCNNHGCVGDLLILGDTRVGTRRPRQLGLAQDWDLFVWGPSWAAREAVEVTPDDVYQAAKDKDTYEFLRARTRHSDATAMGQAVARREAGAEDKREGKNEEAEVRMPRPALFALASPQRLEAAVDRAMEESIASSCEPKKERVKAWVNLATGKVVISGQDAGEVMHVRQEMEASFEAWNIMEVAITISNRAGREFLLNPTKLWDISQNVGVPLVVYAEGGLCGVTRRTKVRGRAQTEEIATMGRMKLVHMKEYGGTLWCKELDHMRDRITGKRLDDGGDKGYRGTTSQRNRATHGRCQDRFGGRHDIGVQHISTNAQSYQQYNHVEGGRQQPCASRGAIGGAYAISGGGFGGGGYCGAGEYNCPPSRTPSPTAVPTAHYSVAGMSPVIYHQQQCQQFPRAMVAQRPQQHYHHVGVEEPRGGDGEVPYHYGANGHHVPSGPFEQGQHGIGPMNGTCPLPYARRQDGASVHGAGFGPPPPPHAGPTLHYENVTPTGNAAFFVFDKP